MRIEGGSGIAAAATLGGSTSLPTPSQQPSHHVTGDSLTRDSLTPDPVTGRGTSVYVA
jgi:hypothetical protein